jgi:four helix bundle protein
MSFLEYDYDRDNDNDGAIGKTSEKTMNFGHEQLDVYRISLEYVGWAYRLANRLQGIDRHARDQMLRASQSIPLNIAEGNGRGTDADRRRFFEFARGSALECAAIQDILVVCKVIEASERVNGKEMLVRIISMLTKLGKCQHGTREDCSVYGDNDNDNDNDSENEARQ